MTFLVAQDCFGKVVVMSSDIKVRLPSSKCCQGRVCGNCNRQEPQRSSMSSSYVSGDLNVTNGNGCAPVSLDLCQCFPGRLSTNALIYLQ